MYQKLIIIGRLGRDPEMRYTPSGVPVTSFSVATDRRWTDQNGQPQERTVWFRVTAWQRQAEVANQYLTKGQLVMVEGTLNEPTPYQSRDGEWRASLDVRALNFKMLGRRDDSGAASGGGYSGGRQAPSEEAAPTLDEEEIPF